MTNGISTYIQQKYRATEEMTSQLQQIFDLLNKYDIATDGSMSLVERVRLVLEVNEQRGNVLRNMAIRAEKHKLVRKVQP